MSKRSDGEYLNDISEAFKRILSYTEKLSYQDFFKDIKTQDAVVRNLEIVGEAVKKVSSGLRQEHKSVAWSDWAKVRDKLIHHYFGVNLDIVWGIIEESLPEFSSQINKILEQYRGTSS